MRTNHFGSRTISANILYSFIIKGISIASGFLMVPLTLGYLGTSDFGIWLTLSSVIAWFGFFDIGLGNGLRNKFTEAISRNEHALARSYVSTTYAGLTIAMALVFLLILTLSAFIDWNSLLRVEEGSNYNLNHLAVYITALFAVRMVLKLISVVLTADHRPAIAGIFDPLSNIISLVVVYILTVYTTGSLVNFVLVVTAAPVFILLIANLSFFRGEYKKYAPSFSLIEMKYFKTLTGLGVKFFIIQLSVLVIFSTDNFIITRLSGPADVTVYNVAYKYFSIVTMVFTIIMTPMWSAYTKAYTLNDVRWVKSSTVKLIKFWLLIVLALALMVSVSNWFYNVWVGDKLKVPILLSTLMAVFVAISTWNNIFVYFINGTGKITFQLYSSVFAAAANIPLSIYLSRDLQMGPAGVILGTCLCLFPGVILGPLQYNKILNKTDKGIWSK